MMAQEGVLSKCSGSGHLNFWVVPSGTRFFRTRYSGILLLIWSIMSRLTMLYRLSLGLVGQQLVICCVLLINPSHEGVDVLVVQVVDLCMSPIWGPHPDIEFQFAHLLVFRYFLTVEQCCHIVQ